MPMSNARRNATVAVAGIVVLLALVLRWESARHEISGEASRCALSQAVDCDKVQASTYSSVLGVPLSVWAAVGHVILISLVLTGRLVLAGMLVVLNLLLALFLAYVSFFQIGAICLYCTGMQIGILALAILIVPAARRAKPGGLALPGLLAALFVCLGLLGEAYARERSNLLREFRITGVPQRRLDVAGSPILGDRKTPNSGLLFLDFGCPHCRACYAQARALVRKHPRKIHFIIKHYPLDGTCNKYEPGEVHRGACNAARTATAAAAIGKAEHAMAKLFDMTDFYPLVLDGLASDWKSEKFKRIVLRDIDDGRALKFTSVPQGFLNGRPRDPNRILQWLRGR